MKTKPLKKRCAFFRIKNLNCGVKSKSVNAVINLARLSNKLKKLFQ